MEPSRDASDVTQILSAIQGGDLKAADRLLPIVYEELRRLAAQKLSHEKPGQTLQATALVHEAYLRLIGTGDPGWENSGHFFAAAAEAMRRILVDRARLREALKRGGMGRRIDLDATELAIDSLTEDLLALDEALAQLETEDKVKADLVKLRFFGGLTNQEAARALGIPSRTADRYWRYARAWLLREIGVGEP